MDGGSYGTCPPVNDLLLTIALSLRRPVSALDLFAMHGLGPADPPPISARRPTLDAGDLAIEEIVDERKYFVRFVLKHEVTRVQKVELKVAKVTLVGMRA